MKNLLTLSIILLSFLGCEKIEREEPTMLAYVDNVFYDTNTVTGGKDEANFIVIKGDAPNGKITLNFKSIGLVNLPIGGESTNSATFEDSFGNIYSTGENATGEVIITNRTAGRSLTGNFNFTAISPTSDTIVVNNGFFYDVFTKRDIVTENP